MGGKMKGWCSEEFKQFTSRCEMCSTYEDCKKRLVKFQEEESKKELRSYEVDIKQNQEKFKYFRKITDAEVIIFKHSLEEDLKVDTVIHMFDLYKED
jgi:hypothetical protein